MNIELLITLGITIFAICLMIAYSVIQYNANIELIKRYEWYETVLAALPPDKQQEAALKMYEIILRESENNA